MPRFENLTQEEIEVLFDFVAFVKREPKFIIPPIKKAMLYDHVHGHGEAVELLNDCFYELIKVETLDREELRELAGLVSEREGEYKIEPDDIFHPEREFINETNKANRQKSRTNGQEYL